MHIRASYSDILVNFDSLTPGKQQQWLESQPQPHTKEEAAAIKRTKRLIKLSRDEEKE
jgi:hypothetical protein